MLDYDEGLKIAALRRSQNLDWPAIREELMMPCHGLDDIGADAILESAKASEERNGGPRVFDPREAVAVGGESSGGVTFQELVDGIGDYADRTGTGSADEAPPELAQ